MNGKEVFKYAINKIPKILKKSVENVNLKLNDVDYFIFHQANIRILESVANTLNIPKSKVMIFLYKFYFSLEYICVCVET